MKPRTAVLIATMTALVWAGVAEAQTAGVFRIPVIYRSWTIDHPETGETTLSQIHVPVVTSVRLGTQTDVVLSASGASSTLDLGAGGENDLGGASDVTAQILHRFPGDRFLIQAGANLPTGKTELDDLQLSVARALSHPLFGFSLKQYGQGLDLSVGAAAAFPLGETVNAGLGAGLLIPGEYTLVAEGDDFKPGTQISVSGGVDWTHPDTDARVRLDGSYRIYEPDELAGREIFEEGDQIELQAAATAPVGPTTVSLLGRSVLKGDNTVSASEGETVDAITESPGTSLEARLGVDLPVADRIAVGLAGEWRRFDGSDTEGRDGTAIGAGPSVRIGLGDSALLRVSAMVLTGTLDAGDTGVEQDLSGFALTATLLFAGGTSR